MASIFSIVIWLFPSSNDLSAITIIITNNYFIIYSLHVIELIMVRSMVIYYSSCNFYTLDPNEMLNYENFFTKSYNKINDTLMSLFQSCANIFWADEYTLEEDEVLPKHILLMRE